MATPSQATHWFDSHKGAAALLQSVSARQATHEPGVPVQKSDVPCPEQGPDAPQPHARAVHVFESVGLHVTPQAVHSLALVATQVATPPRSQHSWSEVQPAWFVGLQLPH